MKPFKPFCFFVLFCCLCSLFACEGQHEKGIESTENMDSATASDVTTSQKEPEAADQKIIKHAEIRFQVKDMEASTQRIEQASRQYQALISNTTQQSAGDEQSTDFEFRVKPAQFASFVELLEKESIKLDHRTLSSDDATVEYVDVAARIKAKQASEQRYLALLKEAKNIQEIMQVEEQVKSIREEIESAEARLLYLADQATYSTIKLSIYQIVPVSLSERTAFWTRLYNAFGTGWQLLGSLVIGICYLWPVGLMGLAYWLLRKRQVI